MRISDIFGMGMSPPPSNDECDAISGDAETRAACTRLQNPAVWYSGPTDPDDYPPAPR